MALVHRFDVAGVDSFRPATEPVARLIARQEFDRVGRAGGRTRWITAAQIALGSLVGLRQREDRSIRTRDCAQVAADAILFENDLGPALLIDRDGVHGTSRHAPCLVTLQAGVGSVTRLFVEDIYANKTLRWSERSGLNPRASQLALHTTGALLRHDIEQLRHAVSLTSTIPVVPSGERRAYPDAKSIRPSVGIPATFVRSQGFCFVQDG